MERVRRVEDAVEKLTVMVAHREDGELYIPMLRRLIAEAALRQDNAAFLAQLRAQRGVGQAANGKLSHSTRKAA